MRSEVFDEADGIGNRPSIDHESCFHNDIISDSSFVYLFCLRSNAHVLLRYAHTCSVLIVTLPSGRKPYMENTVHGR
jgi:hypothetical protein